MPPESSIPSWQTEQEAYDRSLEGRYDTIWYEYKRQIDDLNQEWVRGHRDAGYVYFAELRVANETHENDLYRVKIGIARKPAARFAQLNRFSVVMPMRIVPSFIFFSPNARSLEAQLHWALNRYRLDGEWFMLPGSVLITFSEVWYTTGMGDETRFLDYDGSHFTLAQMLEECQRTEVIRRSTPEMPS